MCNNSPKRQTPIDAVIPDFVKPREASFKRACGVCGDERVWTEGGKLRGPRGCQEFRNRSRGFERELIELYLARQGSLPSAV